MTEESERPEIPFDWDTVAPEVAPAPEVTTRPFFDGASKKKSDKIDRWIGRQLAEKAARDRAARESGDFDRED